MGREPASWSRSKSLHWSSAVGEPAKDATGRRPGQRVGALYALVHAESATEAAMRLRAGSPVMRSCSFRIAILRIFSRPSRPICARAAPVETISIGWSSSFRRSERNTRLHELREAYRARSRWAPRTSRASKRSR